MRKEIAAYIETSINVFIYALVAILPLLFVPFTTEFFEIPKLVLLSVASLILVTLWVLKWVIQGKVVITRTLLDIPLLILAIIIILSTVFTDSRYVSIFGNFPRIHGSIIAWITYIIFYFVTVSNIKSRAQVKTVCYTLLISTTISALVSLISYFGLFLPLPFAKAYNFTPTGSSFSQAALITLLLPFSLIAIVTPTKLMPRALAIIISSLFILTNVLIGSTAIYLGTLVAVALTVLVQKNRLLKLTKQASNNTSSPIEIMESFVMSEDNRGSAKKDDDFSIEKIVTWVALLVPVICFVVILMSFIPMGKFNALYNLRNNFPREIQLPFSESWKVAISSFRDTPFLGTGPGTYLFNFTQYKPIEHNSTTFWNINFDTAYNEYMIVLSTLGGLGLLSLLFLSFNILSTGIRGVLNYKSYAEKDKESGILGLALSIASILVVVLLLFHATTLLSIVISLVVLAMLMGLNRDLLPGREAEDLTIGIKTQRSEGGYSVSGDALPVLILIPVIVLVIFAFWNAIKIVQADYFHRKALEAANTKGIDTYNYLVQAENLNPWVDLYRNDLAQTNFALANNIVASRLQAGGAAAQASPSGALSDQDKQTIQTLLSQAISEAQNSIRLSPRNAQNWEILASIYRQIAGVAQNALSFSLDAYGRAIQRDPLNPLLRLNVGGVYYSIKNYDLAVRFFSDAINVKPDYANAYYNLAVALRDKGDFENAKLAGEQVTKLVDIKSPDYKVASEFLADLKEKAATMSGKQATGQSNLSGQSNSALQEGSLPKVLDLPKPDNIATPAAVNRNPKASALPTPSPTQSAQPAASATPIP
jgi:tetratricopeptide (TPR) repeat protein